MHTDSQGGFIKLAQCFVFFFKGKQNIMITFLTSTKSRQKTSIKSKLLFISLPQLFLLT